MDPVTMTMMGMQVAGGVSGFFGKKKEAKEAKRAARAQARTLRRQFDIVEGRTLVNIGASGVRMRGTPARYYHDMAKEHRQQVIAVRKYGSAMASSIRKQGTASLINGFTGAASVYRQSDSLQQLAIDKVGQQTMYNQVMKGTLAPINNVNMIGTPVRSMSPMSPMSQDTRAFG